SCSWRSKGVLAEVTSAKACSARRLLETKTAANAEATWATCAGDGRGWLSPAPAVPFRSGSAQSASCSAATGPACSTARRTLPRPPKRKPPPRSPRGGAHHLFVRGPRPAPGGPRHASHLFLDGGRFGLHLRQIGQRALGRPLPALVPDRASQLGFACR